TPPPSPDGVPDAKADADAAHDEPDEPSRRPPDEGGALRTLFYALWLGALPFALTIGAVWVLTPPEQAASPGALRVFVRDQQIPAGIVLFTMFAMIVWRFRHDLPLAGYIGVGGRKDIPAAARARFEDAAALVDEARRILRSRRREVERELTTSERDQLAQALASLEKAIGAAEFDAAEFDATHARADRAVGEHLSRWRKGEMREYAESIGIAVAVALLLRAFVVEAFKIPSGSMIPTLMVGDHIFVNKFTYGPLVPWTDTRLFARLPPARADVMVFKFPENMEQDFIKRVIALPGDTLEAIDGRPVINGRLLPHCYVGRFHVVDETKLKELFIEYMDDRAYLTLFEAMPTQQTCAPSEECPGGLTCRGGVCGALQGPFHVGAREVWVMGDNRNNSHDSRTWRGGLGAGVPFENIKGRAMFVWMSFGPGGGVAQDRLFVNVMGRPKVPANQEPGLDAAVEKCLANRPPLSETTPPPAH
ncbi:MAG TPA: signal peptidase I, partial [Byssovorax sp.]